MSAEENRYDVAIIGAGASGMMAAIRADIRGKKVLLVEKMSQAGLKLRITGKGRCNVGNVSEISEFLTHCGSDPHFLEPSLRTFFHEELIAFFEQGGVPLVVERGKRIFPKSGKAFDVFKVLINKIEKSRITLMKGAEVRSIDCLSDKVVGITLGDGTKVVAPQVILAAGGESYPLTGSTGDGVRLAQQVGHTIVPCYPALVGLKVEERVPPTLNGFPMRLVKIRCFNPTTKEEFGEWFGDMSFEKGYLEGPIILSLSRKIAARIGHEPITMMLDLKPSLNGQKLEQKLLRDVTERRSEPLRSILRGWLPKPLADLFVSRLPRQLSTKRGTAITAADRQTMQQLLKQMPFTIIGTEGWVRAVVTQGGVSLDEIDPETLASKKVEGLFFAGEVMDLDADTGGYNLQIAFSTGFLAGSSV